MSMKRLFQHDCDQCVPLGRYQKCDLYYHGSRSGETVIARYGDNGEEYISGLALVAIDERLAEANRRAIKKGLIACN